MHPYQVFCIYVMVVQLGVFNSVGGVASDSFSCFWQLTPVFFLLGFYAQPRYFGLCQVYCNFFCSVQLISFGGLPFSQMKHRGNGSLGERVRGSPGEVEGEETLKCFISEEKSSSSWLGPCPVQSQTFKHLAMLAICSNSQSKTEVRQLLVLLKIYVTLHQHIMQANHYRG